MVVLNTRWFCVVSCERSLLVPSCYRLIIEKNPEGKNSLINSVGSPFLWRHPAYHIALLAGTAIRGGGPPAPSLGGGPPAPALFSCGGIPPTTLLSGHMAARQKRHKRFCRFLFVDSLERHDRCSLSPSPAFLPISRKSSGHFSCRDRSKRYRRDYKHAVFAIGFAEALS